MDDFVILSPDKEQLRNWLARIEQFLREELKLEFKPENYHTGSKERYRLCRLQTQGNAQESTKGQHKAHKAYYQEVRERENHKRAVTKEYTELDGTRRTRRQL